MSSRIGELSSLFLNLNGELFGGSLGVSETGVAAPSSSLQLSKDHWGSSLSSLESKLGWVLRDDSAGYISEVVVLGTLAPSDP